MSIEFIHDIIRGPPYEKIEEQAWKELEFMRSTRNIKRRKAQKIA